MDAAKISFLKDQYISSLRSISPETKPAWGKMTFQQMVEHMSDFIKISSGKTVYTEFVTPIDKIPAYKNFIMTEKEFRENTVSPILPETPLPVRNATVGEALNEIEEELRYFFQVFEKNKLAETRNPIFGDLNYEENIALLYKHAKHHLKQFNEKLKM
jgi:hypothetical protein